MCCIRKDLLKTQHFLGLMLCTASNITARIPLQSAARTSHADSFSPGEAIAPAALLCSKISHAAWRAMRQNFFENFFIF